MQWDDEIVPRETYRNRLSQSGIRVYGQELIKLLHLNIVAAKYSTCRRQTIDVRRFDIRNTIAPQFWPQVVDANQQYVGLFICSERERRKTKQCS